MKGLNCITKAFNCDLNYSKKIYFAIPSKAKQICLPHNGSSKTNSILYNEGVRRSLYLYYRHNATNMTYTEFC